MTVNTVTSDTILKESLTRQSLPRPPSIHWILLLILSIITLGLFAIIWSLVQANWARRVDPTNKSLRLIVIGYASIALMQYLLRGNSSIGFGSGVDAFFAGFAPGLIFLVGFAYFEMADSIEKITRELGIPIEMDAISLCFIPEIYIQSRMSWLAKWKRTGLTDAPTKSYRIWGITLLTIFVCILIAHRFWMTRL